MMVLQSQYQTPKHKILPLMASLKLGYVEARSEALNTECLSSNPDTAAA